MAAALDPQLEVLALRAEMAAMQEKIANLSDSATNAKSSSFNENWWKRIKQNRPDDFLASLITVDCDDHITPNAVWTVIASAQDRRSLFAKMPETVKAPKLSDEAWAIVKKDRPLESKALEIRKQMKTARDLANIWIPLVGSMTPEIMATLAPETRKLMNAMTAGICLQSAHLNVELRNVNRVALGVSKVDLDLETPHADEEDTEILDEFKKSTAISNAIVVGMKANQNRSNRSRPRNNYKGHKPRGGGHQRVVYDDSAPAYDPESSGRGEKASGRSRRGRGRGQKRY
jgi:hypothetical protein